MKNGIKLMNHYNFWSIIYLQNFLGIKLFYNYLLFYLFIKYRYKYNDKYDWHGKYKHIILYKLSITHIHKKLF